MQVLDFTDFNVFPLKNTSAEAIMRIGYKYPSQLQIKTFSFGLCGYDLVVQARDGVDKTLSIILLALENVDVVKKKPDSKFSELTDAQSEDDTSSESTDSLASFRKAREASYSKENFRIESPQVLLVGPTYRSVSNIVDCLGAIASPEIRYGIFMSKNRVSIKDDIRASKRGLHIVIGTPGRLLHLAHLSFLDLSQVKLFVLDHADYMSSFQFDKEIGFLLSKLRYGRQIAFFSTHYPKLLTPLIKRYMREVRKICVKDSVVKIGSISTNDHRKTKGNSTVEDEINFEQGYYEQMEVNNKEEWANQIENDDIGDNKTVEEIRQTECTIGNDDSDDGADGSEIKFGFWIMKLKDHHYLLRYHQ